MKSVVELKADFDQASAAHMQAVDALTNARIALTEGILVHSGFKDCVVEFDREIGHGSKRRIQTQRFLATATGRYQAFGKVRGRVVRADGTLGSTVIECLITEGRNLGPFNGIARKTGDSE